jgi:D-threo-aldose 1-dehydrogenase
VIIGGVFNSGILASGTATPSPYYNYRPADATIMDRVRRIEAVCDRFDVSLSAAALQFPLGHPAVTSVIPGVRSESEVNANVRSFLTPIPGEFWSTLREEQLIDPEAPVPDPVVECDLK